MRLQTRLYVTTQGCTNISAARELAYELAPLLDELHHRNVIAGYQALVLKSEDDYEYHDLDRSMIERETLGVFPAIVLNVTYRIDMSEPDLAAIAPMIARCGFQPILVESDP